CRMSLLIREMRSTLLPTSSSLFFSYLSRATPRSTLFPYTTLFRSGCSHGAAAPNLIDERRSPGRRLFVRWTHPCCRLQGCVHRTDRKSTRLNSSHVAISYAVFCFKKKNQTAHLVAADAGRPHALAA